MSRKMILKELTLWHGGDDLPPATAAKQAKPEKVLDLTRHYPKVGQRIGMLKKAS